MSGAWVCEPCARRLQLPPGGGPSYGGGTGWCGAGQHRTAAGERLVWHGRVAEIEVERGAGSALPPADQPEQLALF